MTDLNLRITRVFHDEHMAVLALLERFDAFLRAAGDGPPAAGDAAAAAMLGALGAVLEGEISDHFAFEEEALFPFLAEAGAAGIGEMLREEHGEIRPLCGRLTELAGNGLASGFSAPDWDEFRRLGAALIDLLGTHAQKEEMGLLPILESVIDAQQDAGLAERYALLH